MGKGWGMNDKKEAAKLRKAMAQEEKREQAEREREQQLTAEWSVGARDTSKQEAEREKRLNKQREKKALEEQLVKESSEIRLTRTAKLSNREGLAVEQTMTMSSSKQQESFVASNVDDALDLMTALTYRKQEIKVERHPERRMKAAWMMYLETNLPRIRRDHPKLRYSQHVEILRDEWAKSPENPMNQLRVAYNARTEALEEVVEKQTQETLSRLQVRE
jgi:hypothetical protein